MKTNEALRALLGGAVVYVVMAACSSSQDAAQHAGAGFGSQMSAGGATGSGGAAQEREAGFMGGLVDALVDPVVEANAALPPDVSSEPCDKRSPLGDSGSGYLYAEHQYPGKTKTQLAALLIVGHLATPATAPIAGYPDVAFAAVYVRDGSAAVVCGSYASPSYDNVTFILPSAI